MILAGGGLIASGAWDELRALADRHRIPVTMSMPGMGAYPSDGELSLGLCGYAGSQYANMAMYKSDLLIGIGTTFHLRQTGSLPERMLEKGRVAIFAAGTSNPYFSTDTAATLRALEIKADVIVKATRVDGVYDRDPLQFPDEAVRYSEVSYLEVLAKALGVMDSTAIAMCRDNKLPIIVFNLNTTGNIMRVAMGEPVGTVIH